MIDWLKGKKTYLIAIGTIIYAVSGAATGQIDVQTAIQMILAALGGMTMRAGISNSAR